MVPDRWETVWRTLVFFGIFLHIINDRAALSYTDDGLMRELHGEFKVGSTTNEKSTLVRWYEDKYITF
jgi:hypothetical protein